DRPADGWAAPAPNTGLPASGPTAWGTWGGGQPGPTPTPGPYGGRFAPPDPAAVSGPPWPTLVATPSYARPRLIRWPIVVGLVILAAAVASILTNAATAPPSRSAWLAAHENTISKINRDQSALASDNPSNGGQVTRWIADWRQFHDDAVTAASLPNPGGAATAPWREMLNDYVAGSSEIVQAFATQSQSLLLQAESDLKAGDTAAGQFNRAMGITGP
ncbi:MAG: hypothetical protein ACRDYY_15865, partial [Acidimicrobiales bacterium]